MAGAPDKSLSLQIVTTTEGAGLTRAVNMLAGVSAAVAASSTTFSSAAEQADRYTLAMTRAAQAAGGLGAVSAPPPAAVPGGGTTTGPVPASPAAPGAPVAPTVAPSSPPPAPASAPAPAPPSSAPGSTPGPVYGPKEWWQDAIDQGWKEVPDPGAAGSGVAPATPAADASAARRAEGAAAERLADALDEKRQATKEAGEADALAAEQADRLTLSMLRAERASRGAGAAVPGTDDDGGASTGPVPAPGAAPSSGAPAVPVRTPPPAAPASAPVPAAVPAPVTVQPVVPAAVPVPVQIPTAPVPTVTPSPAGGGGAAAPGGTVTGAVDATGKLAAQLNATSAAAGKAKEGMAGYKEATDAAAASSAASGAAAAEAGDASSQASDAATQGAEAQTEQNGQQQDSVTALTGHMAALVEALKAKADAAAAAGSADAANAENTYKAGRAALGALQIVESLQHGLGSMANSVPMVAQAFGAGAGLAGILGIVGEVTVAVINKFDLLGIESRKLAAEQARLGKTLRDAVISADDEKESIDEAEAALRKHEDAVEEATRAYSNLTAEIARTQAAREALNRSIVAETDADLALKLTQIAQDKEDGKITEADAIRQSAAAKREADAIKFKTEDDAATKRMADMSSDAKGLDRQAQEKAENNAFLRQKGRDLMDTEGVEQIDKRIADAQKKAADLRAEFSKLQDQEERLRVRADSYGEGPINSPIAEAERKEAEAATKKMDELRAKMKEAYAKQRELMDQKKAHEDAAKATESNDADAFQKKLRQEEIEEEQIRLRASKIRASINDESDLQTRNRRTYQTNVQVSEATEKLDTTRAMKIDAEQVKREEARDLQRKREAESEADEKQMRQLREQGVDVTKAQQELADRRRRERRAEDERREQKEKDEKQQRLAPPDPIGPTQGEPGPWEGPTKSGFQPGGPPAPVIIGTPQERRQAMDNFRMTPADREAEARLSDRQARERAGSRGGGSGDESAATQAVRGAADALGRSAGDAAAANTSLVKEMVGILQRQQRAIDNQTRQIKTLESQVREGRTGR